MKKTLLSFALGLFALTAVAQQLTVEVRNNTAQQRQELIEVDAKMVYKKLGVQEGRNFKVINAVRQEVIYQITHDGKILIDASVRPYGTAEFTIMKGQPRDAKVYVCGRQYPERVDDIAWENDRGAYRLYGPALQRNGERAFGNDVWVKNTPDLEVEKRYKVELENHPAIQQLKKAGKTEEAAALEEATTYHFDHGYGLDCYKVGPSLGCGAPALMDGTKIIFPYCYKDYQILDNGPLRFTVSLTYHPTEYQGQQLTEHRVLSLDKGSNFCEATVWYDGISQPTDVLAGIAIRPADTSTVVKGKGYIHYADPTVDPERHQFQIYSALLFPDQQVEITTKDSHGVGIMKGYQSGQRFHYYFGAAWSEFDVRSQDEWQCRIQGFMQAKQHPLVVEVKK